MKKGEACIQITRNGVVYFLPDSKFIANIYGIKYYFSSQRHLDKFKAEFITNREMLFYSLHKRFRLWMNFDILADLVFYKKVETRGFYIEYGGYCFTCLEDITLAGEQKILPRSQTQSENLMLK